MPITITPEVSDFLGLSGQAQISVNRLTQWAGEVNASIGSSSETLRVVASTAACKAIAAVDRADGDVLVLADSGQLVRFSAASSAPESLGPPITVIQPTAGSGRWLAVALPPAKSVAAAQLAADVAGSGLGGADGAALAVNVDGSTIEVNTDALRIKPAGVGPSQLSLITPVGTGFAAPLAPALCSVVMLANTAGNNDFLAAGVQYAVIDAMYLPDATVGATSSVQIQTAGGAGNVTEALDISNATAGEIKRFAELSNAQFGPTDGFRVVTTGTDVGGALILTCVRL